MSSYNYATQPKEPNIPPCKTPPAKRGQSHIKTSDTDICNIFYKLREILPLENPNFCVTVLAILDVVASLYRYTSSTLCQSTWLRLNFRLWIAAAKRNNMEFRWVRGKQKPLQTERRVIHTHTFISSALLYLNPYCFLPWKAFTYRVNLTGTKKFGDYSWGHCTSSSCTLLLGW